MGWSVPYHTHSRDELVDWLLQHQNEPGHCEIIDHSRRSNVLYALFRHVSKRYRFIVAFLLEGPSPDARRAGDRSWGYKDIDESSGPRVYDCPERLLRQSDAQDTNAIAWREACRRERREQAERRRLSKACRPGDRLRYRACWNQDGSLIGTVIFVHHHTSTFFVGKDLEGKLWRYRWSAVVTGDTSEAANSDAA